MWYLIFNIFMTTITLPIVHGLEKKIDQIEFDKIELYDWMASGNRLNTNRHFKASLSKKIETLLEPMNSFVQLHNHFLKQAQIPKTALIAHFDVKAYQSELTNRENKKQKKEVRFFERWKKEKRDDVSFTNKRLYEKNELTSDQTKTWSHIYRNHKHSKMTDVNKPQEIPENQRRLLPVGSRSKNLILKNRIIPSGRPKNYAPVMATNAFSESFQQQPVVDAMFTKTKPYTFDLDRWESLWDWEGYYEVEDLTSLSGRNLSRRNLFLTDTDSDLGLIASLYDEELSCRIFSRLLYFEPDRTLTSDQPLGYQQLGRLELKQSETSEYLLGTIKNTSEGTDYLFKATKILDAPIDSEAPCSLADLKGDYTGFVGDIPGIINIEITDENKTEVKFTTDQYGSISTEIESSYRPSSGRLFMINKKTSYPFIWRLIAESKESAPCTLAGFAFSTFNSQLRPATFKRITP